MREILLRVEGLSKHYILRKHPLAPKIVIKAVDGISLTVGRGETLGLIGESGSGKTTTGELVLGLLRSDSGRIWFEGTDITSLEDWEMRKLRKDMQIIFQLSQEALDPKMTIGELVAEPLWIHRIAAGRELEGEVCRLLDLVGLARSERDKFPYQLSGGQKQRVGIARAIACRPKFVVCDEPVSALDVSVQGQILNLLGDLKREFKLTYLFISHDLKVVSRMCERIAVMHKGKIVELGSREEIVSNPREPYTRELISSIM